MNELIEFPSARLNEDEAAALATVIPHPVGDGITDDTDAFRRTPNTGRLAWLARSEVDEEEGTPVHWVISDPDLAAVAHAMGLERGTGRDVAVHIARHDPARALREVEAGRRILERHRDDGYGCQYCERWIGPGPCPDLADLLYRWAGHPDYDGAWAPVFTSL